METKNSISAEEYFNNQPKEIKKILIEVKNCILEAAPNAKELLNYNIPAYSLVDGGKREQQIMIAAYKKHIGFYPHPTTIEYFKSELKDFKIGKGSVQFSIDKPIPKNLIIRMVKYRLQLLKSIDKK